MSFKKNVRLLSQAHYLSNFVSLDQTWERDLGNLTSQKPLICKPTTYEYVYFLQFKRSSQTNISNFNMKTLGTIPWVAFFQFPPWRSHKIRNFISWNSSLFRTIHSFSWSYVSAAFLVPPRHISSKTFNLCS